MPRDYDKQEALTMQRYLVLAEHPGELPYIESRHELDDEAFDAAETAARRCPEQGVRFSVCEVHGSVQSRVIVEWAAR